jgi:hypothetical protein
MKEFEGGSDTIELMFVFEVAFVSEAVRWDKADILMRNFIEAEETIGFGIALLDVVGHLSNGVYGGEGGF